ncbi:hypothetical protein [Parvivirga hydrogeniphila]|nr:hypothetical protein [Parvivirga hydrogeniphila]
MSEISPFQSPYKHWRSGLLLEMLTAAGFISALVVLAYVLAAVI